jgi:hypothetical protein
MLLFLYLKSRLFLILRDYTIRGQKVMFDFDLAAMYGVETYYVLKLHCNLMITSLGRR